MTVFAPRLNELILDFTKDLKYSVADNAPNSFADLKASQACSSLVVWSGNSENTIYSDPKVNHAFRAMHDFLHLKLNAPFTLEGEIYVAKEQARLIQSDDLGAIVLAEIVGQAEYLEKTGQFITNQVEFIKQYLKGV